MILTFIDEDAAAFFAGKRIARFANVALVLQRKLQLLDSAATLEALRVPPGNRLESLVGDRKGQHSIRVNEQFRVCFVWTPEGIHDVEIVDYH